MIQGEREDLHAGYGAEGEARVRSAAQGWSATRRRGAARGGRCSAGNEEGSDDGYATSGGFRGWQGINGASSYALQAARVAMVQAEERTSSPAKIRQMAQSN